MEETALIIITLSPSTINSENPASIANSIVFRHDNASASSLSTTAAPLADKAAITVVGLLLVVVVVVVVVGVGDVVLCVFVGVFVDPR